MAFFRWLQRSSYGYMLCRRHLELGSHFAVGLHQLLGLGLDLAILPLQLFNALELLLADLLDMHLVGALRMPCQLVLYHWLLVLTHVGKLERPDLSIIVGQWSVLADTLTAVHLNSSVDDSKRHGGYSEL